MLINASMAVTAVAGAVIYVSLCLGYEVVEVAKKTRKVVAA